MLITIHTPQAIHEIGTRSNQEDCIFPAKGAATAEDRLFVLCDGMGGHERGEVASAAICQGLSIFFESHILSCEILTDDQLREALEYAYQKLDACDNGEFHKSGTTMTLLYFHRGGCTAAHIGDSRIYHVRPSSKSILYQSRDHSLVFELYQSGEITYAEMKTHPRKNQVSRAMIPGVNNRKKADIVHITDILPDDYFLLCSDGVLENLENDDIINLLCSSSTDKEKCLRLEEITCNNDDNHSAYIVHVKTVTREEDDENLLDDEQKVKFNAINILPSVQVQENDDVKIAETNKSGTAIYHSDSGNSNQDSSSRGFLKASIIILILLVAVFIGYSYVQKTTMTGNAQKSFMKYTENVSDETDSFIKKTAIVESEIADKVSDRDSLSIGGSPKDNEKVDMRTKQKVRNKYNKLQQNKQKK